MRPKSYYNLALAVLLACASSICAQELKTIKLPPPDKQGGKPLMQALNERKSAREFSSQKLPLTVLSNLLWAACGVNRPDGHHTSPTASNRQEIDVYIAAPDGLYLYESKDHQLKQILAEDIRALTGTQPFPKDAAVNLIYVADLAKGGRTKTEDVEFYSGADTAFIAQNVYLFCSSEGLATVVRASVDRAALAKAMKLRPDQKICLAQSVGYPVK